VVKRMDIRAKTEIVSGENLNLSFWEKTRINQKGKITSTIIWKRRVLGNIKGKNENPFPTKRGVKRQKHTPYLTTFSAIFIISIL